MKYCSSCGKQIQDEAKFCEFCGATLEPIAELSSENEAEIEKGLPTESTQSNDNWSAQVAPIGYQQSTAANQSLDSRDLIYKNQKSNQIAQDKKTVSPLAIVAFVLSLTLILAPVALVLGIIDLICNSRKRKIGLSIAAVAISSTVLISLLASFTNMTESNEESSRSIIETKESTNKTIRNASLGDTVKFDDLEFSVSQAPVFSEYMGGLSGLHKANDNNLYCIIKITVKNPTKESKSFGGLIGGKKYSYVLDYNNGYKYNDSFSSYADFLENYDSIAPLEVLSEKILTFEVPAEVANNKSAPIIFTVKFNSSWNDDAVSWKLR